MKTINPKNQHELVLYYLYTYRKFDMRDLILDTMFYKFQTRLSELEKKHGDLANRKVQTFTNRFGHKGYHTSYSAIDKERIYEIYIKLQKVVTDES